MYFLLVNIGVTPDLIITIPHSHVLVYDSILYIQHRFFSGNGMIKVAAENSVCLEKTEVQTWDRLLKKCA